MNVKTHRLISDPTGTLLLFVVCLGFYALSHGISVYIEPFSKRGRKKRVMIVERKISK